MSIKNRNIDPTSTLQYRTFSGYIYKPSPQTVVAGSDSETYNGAIMYFQPGFGLEAMEFVALQASVHTIAGGITTFNMNIQKASSVNLASAVADLKAHGKQVVYARPTAAMQLAGTTRVAATEVCRILINSSNNENVFHLFWSAAFRPLGDGETR